MYFLLCLRSSIKQAGTTASTVNTPFTAAMSFFTSVKLRMARTSIEVFVQGYLSISAEDFGITQT
jgi:hypothetical protein